jgi:hypothetical protein
MCEQFNGEVEQQTINEPRDAWGLDGRKVTAGSEQG